MKTLIPILLLSLTLSCQFNRKEDLSRLVATWTNREIVFPEAAVFTTYATDTVAYPDVNTHPPYKVVIYADSLGCMSCKMQLDKWKSFIQEVDALTNSQIPFLFFMDTRDISEMKHILRRERFSHPVCIDRKSDLNRLNHFPENPSFHTFLLDHENRVKLIGNPVHNAAIKELYLVEFRGFVP